MHQISYQQVNKQCVIYSVSEVVDHMNWQRARNFMQHCLESPS